MAVVITAAVGKSLCSRMKIFKGESEIKMLKYIHETYLT